MSLAVLGETLVTRSVRKTLVMDKIRKVLEELLNREGAKDEHERLRNRLKAWAESRGFSTELSQLPNGQKPDVLLYNSSQKWLFIGDAKDSEHETPDRTDTICRVNGYIKEFSRLLGGPEVRGGFIAIATNDKDAADSWVLRLNWMAIMNNLTVANGDGPDFIVAEVDATTWVIYW